MTKPRTLAARLSYRLVARAPSGAVGRARVAGRLAPLFEAGFAAVGAPLSGSVVPIANGPAAGLRILAERRSLAWISGVVEPDVQTTLTRVLTAGATFIDAGASVGFFTLLAAHLVGPTGTVVSFEPQPAAAASIRRNVELNAFQNVLVVESAVSSRTGAMELDDVGKATAHIASGGRVREGLRVRVTSLDAFLEEHAELVPTLIKIDVEGHEREVILGMRSTLTAHRPTVVIECHERPERLLDHLDESGYVVSVLGSQTPVHKSPASAHLLAVPAAGATPG